MVKSINVKAKRRNAKKLVNVVARRQFRCEACGARLVLFKRENALICPIDGWTLDRSEALRRDNMLQKQEEKLIDENASKPIIMSIKYDSKKFLSLGRRSSADDLQDLPATAAIIDDREIIT